MGARRKSQVLTNSQDHLWGIRAILAVQSFAWLFFKVFNPTLTVPSATPTGEHVPEASPSTVPGVFGGPGIVGPGADSGIISGSSLQGRDLFSRSLSKSIIPFPFAHSSGKGERAARGSNRVERGHFGILLHVILDNFIICLRRVVLDMSISQCLELPLNTVN
jgi:hypothetical protein